MLGIMSPFAALSLNVVLFVVVIYVIVVVVNVDVNFAENNVGDIRALDNSLLGRIKTRSENRRERRVDKIRLFAASVVALVRTSISLYGSS